MILKILKSTSALGYLLLLLLPVAAFFPYSFSEANNVLEDSLVKNFFNYQLAVPSLLISNLFNIVIFFIAGLIFLNIFVFYKVNERKNYTAFPFYIILLYFLKPELLSVYDVLLLFSLFFFLFKLFQIDTSLNKQLRYFDVAFIISVISIFNYIAVLFYVLPVLAIISYKHFNWKNVFSFILGIVLPHVFFYSIYSLSNSHSDYMALINELFNTKLAIKSITGNELISFIVISLISFAVVVSAFASLKEKKIHIRQKIVLSIFFLIVTFVSILLDSNSLQAYKLLFALMFGALFFFSINNYLRNKFLIYAVDLGFVGIIVYNLAVRFFF